MSPVEICAEEDVFTSTKSYVKTGLVERAHAALRSARASLTMIMYCVGMCHGDDDRRRRDAPPRQRQRQRRGVQHHQQGAGVSDTLGEPVRRPVGVYECGVLQ